MRWSLVARVPSTPTLQDMGLRRIGIKGRYATYKLQHDHDLSLNAACLATAAYCLQEEEERLAN
jgi:hypothetical protein